MNRGRITRIRFAPPALVRILSIWLSRSNLRITWSSPPPPPIPLPLPYRPRPCPGSFTTVCRYWLVCDANIDLERISRLVDSAVGASRYPSASNCTLSRPDYSAAARLRVRRLEFNCGKDNRLITPRGKRMKLRLSTPKAVPIPETRARKTLLRFLRAIAVNLTYEQVLVSVELDKNGEFVPVRLSYVRTRFKFPSACATIRNITVTVHRWR